MMPAHYRENSMQQRMKYILFSATVLILSACGLVPPKPMKFYPGHDRSVEEIAMIGERDIQGGDLIGVTVSAINKQEVRPAGFGLPSKGLQVLPGLTTVSLIYFELPHPLEKYPVSRHIEKDIVINLLAGHSYIPIYNSGRTGHFLFDLQDKGVRYNIECLGEGLTYARPLMC